MLQIVCALALDMPEVLRELEQLHGVPPNVQLSCEPWRHMNHEDQDYICRLSDRTGAYIHELSVTVPSWDLVLPDCLMCQRAGSRMIRVMMRLCTL